MKLAIFIALFLISSAHYGAVGVNNVSISVGGNFNYTGLGSNIGSAQDKKNAYSRYLGGGFDVSIGHLRISEGYNLIHGLESKTRFMMNFDTIYSSGGLAVPDQYAATFNTLSLTAGTTYMMGTKVDNGRVLVDVLGLEIGFMIGRIDIDDKGADHKYILDTGSSFLIGITLPLGVRYILDNGFSIGLSHRLDIALGRGSSDVTTDTSGNTTTITPNGSALGYRDHQNNYLAYNLSLNIGLVFGR